MAADMKLAVVLSLQDQLTGGLKGANTQIKGLQNSVKMAQADFASKYGEIASASKRIGLGFMAVGAAAVAGFGAAAKAASDFNAGLAEVSTLVDTNVVKMDALKKGINAVAMETGQSAEALTGGLYQAISAGVGAGEAIEFLGVAAKAAVAGVTDTETAVNGLTNALNAYGMDSSHAQEMADSMFTAVKAGKTTFEELSQYMFQATASANAVGVSFQELMAATSALTAAGVPTRVAMTQIRAALVGMQRPSEEMNAIFGKLGYANAQTAIEAKGLGFALKAVADEAAGDSGKLMELLGSVEAVQATQVLAGSGAEKFAKDLKDQGEAAGAASEAYDKMSKSTDAAMKRIRESSKVMVRTIGDTVIPVFAKLVEWAQPVVTALAEIAQTKVGSVLTMVALGASALMVPLGVLMYVVPQAALAMHMLKAALNAEALAAFSAKIASYGAAGGMKALAAATWTAVSPLVVLIAALAAAVLWYRTLKMASGAWSAAVVADLKKAETAAAAQAAGWKYDKSGAAIKDPKATAATRAAGEAELKTIRAKLAVYEPTAAETTNADWLEKAKASAADIVKQGTADSAATMKDAATDSAAMMVDAEKEASEAMKAAGIDYAATVKDAEALLTATKEPAAGAAAAAVAAAPTAPDSPWVAAFKAAISQPAKQALDTSAWRGSAMPFGPTPAAVPLTSEQRLLSAYGRYDMPGTGTPPVLPTGTKDEYWVEGSPGGKRTRQTMTPEEAILRMQRLQEDRDRARELRGGADVHTHITVELDGKAIAENEHVRRGMRKEVDDRQRQDRYAPTG